MSKGKQDATRIALEAKRNESANTSSRVAAAVVTAAATEVAIET